MKNWISAGAAVAVMTLASSVSAGDTIVLSLKANGTDIQGEGRNNGIECVNFEQAVETAREAGSGMATGRRQYAPLKCTKKTDKSSPLIAKALATNQVIEGTFRFYRPSQKGGEEQYYTITIKQGRVSSMKTLNGPGAASATEEVSFVYQSISWTYTNGGITHEDSTGAAR